MSIRKSGYSFKCIVKSCGEMKTQKESVSFFSFPKDPARCEIWLERCKLPADILSKKNIKLCGKHFEKNMFLNFLENRLKPDAIPTLFPDKKDSCDTSTSLQLSSSDKVEICTTLTKTVSCGSNSPLKMIDDPSKYTTETYSSNEVLALPLPGSPGVHDSAEYSMSSGTSSSITSEKSRYLDSPVDFIIPSSSKSCQTLKALSEKTPRKVLLRQQLKTEKEARLKAEKTILGLSHQLTEFNTVDNFLSLCEQHLSPSVLTIVKSHMMCKTRNPHGYRDFRHQDPEYLKIK
ncbi:52 kDa repressor of the inhibitor of the protein kinase-like [Myzus persicae]|uniref:52 kDa repressor of the inhibitor of the protein kinase-like n=1 Tax=Myzus persicae TaxID=13164 RepID=UPI000B93901C|nr:52 kDa repressor of the inhibitor of the protein kinase-like [Myzus persicae]